MRPYRDPRVLCRTRPRRTGNFRPRKGPPVLVERRGGSDGFRYLVHALHRNAGLPLADPGAVRLAHGLAVSGAAIVASGIALFVVSRHEMGVIRAVLGSIFMG